MGVRTASQGILKDLFKAQKLQDTEIDSRMESQSALVGTQGGVELHTVAPVDLDFILVVLPDDPELDDAFGYGAYLESGLVFGIFLEQ